MNVTVLRLGHRFSRDARISTHLALTARAFGAERIVYDVEDTAVRRSVDDITASWGGDFAVEFTKSWRKYVSGFDGVSVHLTMYGLPVGEIVPKVLKDNGNVLVIVGGAKVPSDVYGLVDYNVGVGSQPHSEVAALAVFLDRLFDGGELSKEFNGKIRVIPQKRGKKVVESD